MCVCVCVCVCVFIKFFKEEFSVIVVKLAKTRA